MPDDPDLASQQAYLDALLTRYRETLQDPILTMPDIVIIRHAALHFNEKPVQAYHRVKGLRLLSYRQPPAPANSGPRSPE